MILKYLACDNSEAKHTFSLLVDPIFIFIISSV